MRNPFGNLSAPERGYIWDYALRASVSVRSYGEFVDNVSKSASGDVVAVGNVPGLKGLAAPTFAGFDLGHHRREARGQLAAGVPRLRAQRQSAAAVDHPSAERSHEGHGPRRAHAARDDRRQRSRRSAASSRRFRTARTGRTRPSSSSKTMRRAARTTWIRTARCCSWRVRSRRTAFVDHTFYTTSGVLRTIELILGLRADEPVRRRRDAAVQRVHRHAEPQRLPALDAARPARREEPRRRHSARSPRSR